MSTKSDGFKDFILDQLTELDEVTGRAMFGGYGLYQKAKFFAIIHKGRLYFKVTTATAPRYKEQGMKPFRPNAKQTLKSFFEVPIDVIEDAEALTQWATEAVNETA
ncbi:MAG TPA: TfoX/Sxy family protein [Nitrospira sp.]|jgi:DNA transformation protein|nr:TfoX/Sxy family protein [Nitrospira sp.]